MARQRNVAVPATALFCLSACQGVTDPGIEYACIPPPPGEYTEQFDYDSMEPLTDRCWNIENADEDDVDVGGGDLVVRHAEPVEWQSSPRFVRRIEDDFMVITKAEASSGVHSSFCGLGIDDAAGIVVRGNGVTASLLVTPYLDSAAIELGGAPEGVECEDDAEKPPHALVYGQSTDPDSQRAYTAGVGFDGEADIALCRRGRHIAYFYRTPTVESEWTLADWASLKNDDANKTDKTDDIGIGPVDVGLTTSLTDNGATELGVEGHFNWVMILPLNEDCRSVLEDLEEPPSD